MPYYAYAMKSEMNDFVYIGSTQNLNKRIELHNSGKVKSTKAYRPWKLLEYQTFDTRSEAFRQEHFLKSHQQKDRLKAKYKAA